MKVCTGSGNTALPLLIYTLDEGDRSVSRPGLFTSGTEPTEQEEAGWPPEAVWTFWRGEISFACSLVSMRTT